MAEDDIYHSKVRYESFIANLNDLRAIPRCRPKRGKVRKYYRKNPINLEYFKKMDNLFRAKDNSYIRRLRLFRTLLIVVYTSKKDLSKCAREDINKIVEFSHTVNKSVKSKEDFVKDLRYIWRCLFP